jgi:hypothetical protein
MYVFVHIAVGHTALTPLLETLIVEYLSVISLRLHL